MNFYAHLVAASWQSSEIAFALGSMLPDFASMARVHLPQKLPTRVAAGVAFHHQSDQVFHRLDAFRQHESWTLAHLLDSGFRRGPSRGVAHVGVELSLDGALVGDSGADRTYLAALDLAASEALGFPDDEDAARFQLLSERLRDLGVPTGYRESAVVAQRLVRIMQPRPLLRLDERETERLEETIRPMHDRVVQSAGALMHELRAELST